jgi:hypothetical protein
MNTPELKHCRQPGWISPNPPARSSHTTPTLTAVSTPRPLLNSLNFRDLLKQVFKAEKAGEIEVIASPVNYPGIFQV